MDSATIADAVNSPAGVIRFLNHAIIRDPGTLDSYAPDALQHDVRELPLETLSFLLPSRYWTASCLTSPDKPSALLPLDGHGYRLFATSSIAFFASIT
jgi:hypothetical protein